MGIVVFSLQVSNMYGEDVWLVASLRVKLGLPSFGL
jgi:hypothetical protein